MILSEKTSLLQKQGDANINSAFTFVQNQRNPSQDFQLGLQTMGHSQVVSHRGAVSEENQVCNKDYFLNRTIKPFYKMVVTAEKDPENVMMNYLKEKRRTYQSTLKTVISQANLKPELADNIKLIEEKNLDYVFQDQEELKANNQFKTNERIEREIEKHVRRCVRFASFWPEICIFKNIFDRASSSLGLIEGFSAREKFVYLGRRGRADQVIQWRFFDKERQEELILQKFSPDAKYSSFDFKKQLRIFDVQKNQEYESQVVNHDPQRLQISFYCGICSIKEINDEKRINGIAWSERETLFMMYSIVQNLIFLRKQKYYYQDIKPENIMIYNIKKGQYGFKLANNCQTAVGMLCSQATRSLHGERSSIKYFGTLATKIFLDPRIVYKRNSGWQITEKDVEQANNYSLALTILEILISNTTKATPPENGCYIISGWKNRRTKRRQQQQQQQSQSVPLSKRKDNLTEREDDFSVEFDDLLDQIKDKYPRVTQILRDILVVKFQQDLQNIQNAKLSLSTEKGYSDTSQYAYKDLKRSLKDFEENQQPLFFVDDKQQSLLKVIDNKQKYSYFQICSSLFSENSITFMDSPSNNQKNNKTITKAHNQEVHQDNNKTQQNSSISEVMKEIEHIDTIDSFADELECCFSFGYLERARMLLERAKNLNISSDQYYNLSRQFNEMIEWYSSKLALECARFHDAITKLENLKEQLEKRQGQNGLRRNVKERLVESYFSAGMIKNGMEQLQELIKENTLNGTYLNEEYLYNNALLYLYMTQKYTDCLVIIHNILNKYVSYINDDIYHPMIAKCMNLRIIILSQQGDHLQAFKQAEIYQKYVRGYFSSEKDLLRQPPTVFIDIKQQQNQNGGSFNGDNSDFFQSQIINNKSQQYLKDTSIADLSILEKQGLKQDSNSMILDVKEEYERKEQEKYENQQQFYSQIQQNFYLEEQQCIGKLNYLSAALNVKAIQNKKVLYDVIQQILTQIEDREGRETASPLYLFGLIVKAKCCIHIQEIDEARRALRNVCDSILTRHSAFDGRSYKIIYPALFAVKLLNNNKFNTSGISMIQLHEWILQKLKSVQHGSILLMNRQRLTYSYSLFQSKDYENAEKQSIYSINSNIFTLGGIEKCAYPLYSLDTKLHAYYMYKIGMFMANENSFKDALSQFNDCLRSISDLHNKTDYFIGECLLQKAYCQYHIKQFDQGLITALKAFNLLTEEARLFNLFSPVFINVGEKKKENKNEIEMEENNLQLPIRNKENEKYINPQQEIFQATYIVALLYNKLGHFNISLEYCQKCIQQQVTVHKENMLRLGQCKMLAANNQKSLKRLVDALVLAEQSLNIYDKILPSHHPDLLQAVYLIFTILRDLQYYKEAKQQMQWVQKIKKAIIKNRNNELKSIDYQNMAMTWLMMGQQDFAIEYLQKSLDINLKMKGLKHPLIAVDLINLAAVHIEIPSSEDKFKAIDFLEEAFEIFKHKENYEYEEDIQNQPYSLDNNQLQLQTLIRLLKTIENSINFLTRDATYLDQLKAIDIVHSYEKIGFMKQQRKLIFRDPYSKLEIAEFVFSPERFLGYTFLCIFPYLNKHEGWLSVFSHKQYTFDIDTHKVVMNIYNNNSELVCQYIKDPTPKHLCRPNILYNIINPTKEVLFTIEETQHRYKENEIYFIKNAIQDKVGELEIAQKEDHPSTREMRIFLLDSTFSLETKYVLCHLPLFLMIHRYGT